MTFREIYDRIIHLWGKRIDFVDGSIVKDDNVNGFYSSELSEQWTKVAETIGTKEPYSDLMVWTMYQVFHRYARQLFSQSIYHLDPTDISKEEIEEEYYTNLQDGNWKEEFQNYKRVIN